MIEVSSDGEAIVVRIHKEIDFSSCAVLEQAMNAAADGRDTRVVVDLSRCGYLDSSCLSLLVRQHRKLGARMDVVVPVGTRVRRMFLISGLLGALPVVESVAEAIGRRLAT